MLRKIVFQNIGVKLLVSFILLISGFLIHNLTVLDSSFGLSYYILDSSGLWKPGLLWTPEHRFLAIFCAFVFPTFVSLFFSISIVFTFQKLWERSKQSGLLFIFVVLTLTYGLHSSDYNGISYFGYWNSNY